MAKKISKIISCKCGQKRFDHTKQSATSSIKTVSKRAIQKTAEATGDLFGNKTADKIANTSSQNIPETNSLNGLNTTSQQKIQYREKDIYHVNKKLRLI